MLEKYILSEPDVKNILLKNELNFKRISKYPKSGQRQVFAVDFQDGKSTILKFVDVTPYSAYEYQDWMDVSTEEIEKMIDEEIKIRSTRVIRELNASKRCPIFPQLEVLDGYEYFKKEQYVFIYYFETKFEGVTLDKSEIYLNEQDIDSVIDFLIQMIKKIIIMNEAGYVHRDITPRNIIYHKGNYEIIDAGLIKHVDDDSFTKTTAEIGTPRYWAPEQAKRTTNFDWDFRTDLYSIGLIAIEIFLPKTRKLVDSLRRDLHFVFELWKEKDNSPKSIKLFTKVISRLSVEQRFRRWTNLNHLLELLEEIRYEEDKV